MKQNLSQNLRKQLICFFDQHPPQLFSNSLRRLLLEYMQEHINSGFFPQFDNFLWAMDDLFQLLDTAAADIAMQTQQKQNATPA
jgi:hypothetical protein